MASFTDFDFDSFDLSAFTTTPTATPLTTSSSAMPMAGAVTDLPDFLANWSLDLMMTGPGGVFGGGPGKDADDGGLFAAALNGNDLGFGFGAGDMMALPSYAPLSAAPTPALTATVAPVVNPAMLSVVVADDEVPDLLEPAVPEVVATVPREAAAAPAPVVQAPVAPAPTKKTAPMIASTSRKAGTKCRSMPATLTYPSNLIAIDAPILPRRGGPVDARPLALPASLAKAMVTSVTPALPTSGAKKRSAADAGAASDDEVDDDDPALVGLGPREAKRMRNTLSARKSRARKAAKLDFLEGKVNELESENSALHARVSDLQQQLLQFQQLQLARVAGAAAAGGNAYL
ncbi:hypothetical protein BC828DRAFT_384375 [Blastocladiella britannica]|nr:hypothetical protein BC828DRAFT_384375 [Blastocladiella britannica]